MPGVPSRIAWLKAGNPSGGSCTPGQAPPNNCASVIAQFKVDPAPFSIFTGGGSKDAIDLSSWNWKDDAGGLPDKDNITNAYARAYTVNGDLILYYGADRFANDGDAQLGFWFFQNNVTVNANGSFDGIHVPSVPTRRVCMDS